MGKGEGGGGGVEGGAPATIFLFSLLFLSHLHTRCKVLIAFPI